MGIGQKKSRKSRITKDGRTILVGPDKYEFRRQKGLAAGERCEFCGGRALICGEWWEVGHVCHWPPKRMGNGFGSDTPETTKWGCGSCHDKLDGRNQKVCPAKPAPVVEETQI